MVPITSEFEGRKRFYAGESGSIYLGTGMHPCSMPAERTAPPVPHWQLSIWLGSLPFKP